MDNNEFALSFQFNDMESLNALEAYVKANPSLDYDALQEDEEISLVVYGTKKDLIDVAAYDHKLHGAGFSFNPQDVLEAIEEL